MKKILVLLLLLTIILSGCASGPASAVGGGTPAPSPEQSADDSGNKESAAKTLDGEIKFYPTVDPDYKTARNEMFDFWFDIPNDWKAKDLSRDGSEYTILSDDEKVQIVISGVMKKETEEEYCAGLAGTGGTISDFTYRDGWIGKQIRVGETERYYVRVDGDSYLVLHINAGNQTEWFSQNQEKLNGIAASGRTTKESYGKDLGGKNSVTMEDLQLGWIKLNLSYGELKKAEATAPVREEAEQYEGLEAKTLFYPDNTQIFLVDDTVYSINVTSPEYATPRGLKVGDSRERLIELYGEPDIKEDKTHWGYNCNGYEVFTVIVDGGKVTEMQVDLAM